MERAASIDVYTHADTLALSGEMPETVALGSRFLAGWTISNHGLTARSVNVYICSPGLEIASFRCRGARTQHGRYHASALVLLPAETRADLAALFTAARRGDLGVRANVVDDAAAV